MSCRTAIHTLQSIVLVLRRGIVLLLAHQVGQSALGVLVNQSSGGPLRHCIDLHFCDEKLQGKFLDVFGDSELFVGGPVPGSLTALHSRHDLQGCEQLGDGLFWQGCMEHAADLVQSGKADTSEFKFILGHSGWGPDQLEGELAANDWYAVTGSTVPDVAK